jgi:transcriptional regulator with XRE-family HTH domain
MKDKLLPIFAHNMTAYQNAAHEAGFNRATCAALANMSRGQWSDMLNGKIAAPSVWTALRIAEVLRCSVDALLTTDPEIRDATVKKVFRAFKLVRKT